MTTTSPPNDYDALVYDGRPERRTHPARLACVAKLFGFSPPDPLNARILEVGCATGANLVPMAYQMPGATFLGFDYSPRQVELARAYAAEVGLSNIQFEVADIRQPSEAWGQFDYIIAHGIFSWVPAEVREALLHLCCKHLESRGIALIDYNVYPGSHVRDMARDFMMFHGQQFSSLEVAVRESRDFLSFLADHVFYPGMAYGLGLKQCQQLIQNLPDSLVAHDYMEVVNQPIRFIDFAACATSHGLEILGDSEISTLIPQPAGAQITERLGVVAQDYVRWEQYQDYFRGREFRRTLLVHEGSFISRQPDLQKLAEFYYSTTAAAVSSYPQLLSMDVEAFRSEDGVTMSTTDPILKVMLTELAKSSPETTGFDELINRVQATIGKVRAVREGTGRQALMDFLFQMIVAGFVQVHAFAFPVVNSVSSRPIANPVARADVRLGRCGAIGMLHLLYDLDAFGAALLPLLDGTRDHAALVTALDESMGRGEGSLGPGSPQDSAGRRRAIEEGMPRILKWMAQSGLLVG